MEKIIQADNLIPGFWVTEEELLTLPGSKLVRLRQLRSPGFITPDEVCTLSSKECLKRIHRRSAHRGKYQRPDATA